MTHNAHVNERDNLTRWVRGQQGHYEVYYLKFNDAKQHRAFWLRYTLTAPKSPKEKPVAELWAIAFDAKDPTKNYAHKRSWPIEALEFGVNRFFFDIDGHRLTHEGCSGQLGNGDNRIAWDITFEPDPLPTFRHFPRQAMYSMKLPKTKVLAPNLSMKVSGVVNAFGDTMVLKSAPGHQAHIWGSQHARQWAWANCNMFEDTEKPVCFEALSAQIAIGPVNIPHLTLCALRVGDEEYLFNTPADLLRSESSYDLRSWHLHAEHKDLRLEAVIENDPARMVGVTYTDPDGSTRICNNSKQADMRLTLQRREGDGWTTIHSLHSLPCGVAYEVVGPEAHPDVTVKIL